ncbi:MAG: hypothetical protein KGL39_50880 [Patescibacteria group bacterium]|nr:hypothetical protein [Patescibacteria group bacterium]
MKTIFIMAGTLLSFSICAALLPYTYPAARSRQNGALKQPASTQPVFNPEFTRQQDGGTSAGAGSSISPGNPINIDTNSIRNTTSDDLIYKTVNGQIYCINRSAIWHRISGECVSTKGNAVAVQVENDFGPIAHYAKQPLSRYAAPNQTIVVLHNNMVIGDNQIFEAMYIGVTNLPAGNYQLWDCGIPVSGFTTNSAPNASTN